MARSSSFMFFFVAFLAGTSLVSAFITAPPVAGTCDGSCGGNAGTCWCDSLCLSFADCCPDATALCPDDVVELDPTCEGSCGGNAGICWCDSLCVSFADCCPDATALCPDDVVEPSDTCVDSCGGNVGLCWCDNLCTFYGDCCDDVADACGIIGVPPPPDDNFPGCLDFAGTPDCGTIDDDESNACWCDALCVSFADCCDDACEACGFCAPELGQNCSTDFCGSVSQDENGFQCWCDTLCTFYQDCCADACDNCSNCSPPPAPVLPTIPNCSFATCGGLSTDEFGFGCWCDQLCVQFNDCCDNACDQCGFCYPPPSAPFPPGEKPFGCAVECGSDATDVNGNVCWCDSLCTLFNDCCQDACTQCSLCFQPPAPEVQCNFGEIELFVTIEVNDPWPEEVTWEVDQLNTFATEYETLIAGDNTGGSFCLKPTSPAAPYFVLIQDSFGDAFLGSFTLEAGGVVILEDGMSLNGGTQKTYKVEVSPNLVVTFTEEQDLPCQEQLDCNGECYGVFFENWTTDVICDDGQSGMTPSGGISFNCAGYNDDAGACDIPYIKVNIEEPFVQYPLDEGFGTEINPVVGSGSLPFPTGEIENASWQEDALFGSSILCEEDLLSKIKIPDFDYGTNGFTISFLFRHDSAVGSAHEYVFSHGSGTPNIFAPDNLNMYLPEESNLAHGIMRFVLKDSNDPASVYYLDSDGLVSSQFARDVPGHINMLDDKWHMATIVQNPGVGYNVYVDGRLSGIGEGTGGDNVDPIGDILLCSRTDFNEFRHFGGFVSNLQFYSNPLNNQEVYQLYHKMGICDSADQVQTTTSERTCCQDPENPFLPGDLTFDLSVNVLDVVKGVSYILQATYLSACEEFVADMNTDSEINVLDIVTIVNLILAEG